MNRSLLVATILLLCPLFSSFTEGNPEPAITRTHLMKDIEPSTVTVGVGMEFAVEEPEPFYSPDYVFVYLGYSPRDYLELGIAAHALLLRFYSLAEAKLDLIDIFTDDRRFSLILMGGIGGRPSDQRFELLYHGGLAVNYRLKENLQLYLGAGSDWATAALNLQGGLYVAVRDWLGFSMNVKVVTGSAGTEPMLSAALLTVF